MITTIVFLVDVEVIVDMRICFLGGWLFWRGVAGCTVGASSSHVSHTLLIPRCVTIIDTAKVPGMRQCAGSILTSTGPSNE